ncbi:MAG: DNA translocase FtsK, partial [Bacteroidales bacterium]|nr:DNA translocase FtsK [Bacteroidales bacterium]
MWLQSILGKPGEIILLAFVLLSFVIFAFNFEFNKIRFKKGEKKPDSVDPDENENAIWDTPDSPQESQNIPVTEPEIEVEVEGGSELPPDADLVIPETKTGTEGEDVEFEIEEANDNSTNDKINQDGVRPGSLETAYDPTLDLPHYKYPPLDLLEDYGSGSLNVNKEELEDNKNKIVKTLNNYAISIDKIKATIGPAVTLYEIIPSAGVRISKIKNLEDDIALSLAALGIRIIAPIPGKGNIGIEVPNQKPETVSIKSILESPRFQNSNFALPFGLGKTITNETFIADLTKMPHILMAGATGQGKSVGLNAIIASLLYKKHPSQVKFVLIDPKKVELTLYAKIERHFLAKLPDSEEAIITDTRKVVRTINSLNLEMDSRYNLLKDAVVRNIKEYNVKFLARKLNPNDGHRFLPYIIVVVDEFADLIMTAGKEIESPLTRLAQLARAVGIHLIIATQRPSVNIITGTIKANFPARIAFR